ncbi:MAG: 23S rRNA (guanosine(2251)-2'-O)-methyltransferase RlmB [Blastocatellia bacterium]|nr:23S rRNA (guanosine(2251)-2'-O)-methyltransferase RlmB [Blastocatellia bacterium]
MAHIYGISPIFEALKAGKRDFQRLLFARGAKPARLEDLRQLARKKGIPCFEEPREKLDQLTGGVNHQGVVAVVSAASYADPSEILDALPENPLLVLLDQVEDPHNLGAIIRTAECAGANGVFITEHHAAHLTDTVVKASAGATEYVPVARVTNLSYFIESLKARHIWVIGVEANGEKSYPEWDFQQPTAIVMGSEGKGLRRLVREHCDMIVSIPLLGQITSLNVSVATGVLLYEAVRQRRAK